MLWIAIWIFIFILLIFGTWFLHIAHLTRQLDRACASDIPTSANDPVHSDFQAILDEYSAAHGTVGLQATIIFPDGTFWNGASGLADQEGGCPITLEHHLYIGSMTKTFTASLVMRQVEEGNIRLNDTIDNWFDFRYADRVTVEMLLNHTSGIPSYTKHPWFLVRYFTQPQKLWETSEIINSIDKGTLEFEPGSQHAYSNSNYLLLGYILEKVTGDPYSAQIARLGKEFGLNSTFYHVSPPNLLIANAYDQSLLHLGRRNLTGFRRSFVSGAYAAGGILSNSHDVATFVHKLFTSQVVSDETLARMLTLTPAPDEDVPAQTGYGLGLRYLEINEEHFAGHSGTIPGYSGIVMHNLEKGYTFALLGNLSTVDQLYLLNAFQTESNIYLEKMNRINCGTISFNLKIWHIRNNPEKSHARFL